MTGTAIPTNGEGRRCDWLNLTTTLADAWRRDPPARPEAGKPQQKERDK